MEIAVASTIPTEQVRNVGAMNFLVERFRNGHPVTVTPSHPAECCLRGFKAPSCKLWRSSAPLGILILR